MTNDIEIITKEKEIVSSLTNEHFETIEFVDIGWTSRVYLINNGELVFKFARNNKVVEEYKNEVRVYKFLKKKSFEVKLPVVKFEDANLRYFGYEGIVGQTLDKYIDNLSEKEKIIIGQRLSGFLKILHESNLDNINIFDISHEEKEFFEKFSISEEFLKTSLKPEIFSAIEFFLENKIKNEFEKLKSNIKLCHGDLGLWNIILNKNQIGIIDFGDVGYYDSSIDFSGIGDLYIYNSLVKHYECDESMLKKINLRKIIIPILEIPYYLEQDNKKELQKNLSQINNLFSSNN